MFKIYEKYINECTKYWFKSRVYIFYFPQSSLKPPSLKYNAHVYEKYMVMQHQTITGLRNVRKEGSLLDKG